MVEVLKERRAVAAQRLITIRVAMGKLSPLMMKMFHQFTVFFFPSSLSRYLFILLFSIFYPRQIMNMLVSLYLLNFNNIFNYEFPFILNFEMLAKNF